MATGDFFTYTEEDSLFGGCDEFVVNNDFFNPIGDVQHLDEHNYAVTDRMSSETTSSSVSLEQTGGCETQAPVLMIPAVDDLTFVDDLLPIHVEPASNNNSSSTSSGISSPPDSFKEATAILLPLNDQDQQMFADMPDVSALVDRETLMEALCLVDMPPNQAILSNNGAMEASQTDNLGLVSTLFEFISSSSAFSVKQRNSSLLPMYSQEEASLSPSSSRNRVSGGSKPSSNSNNEIDVVTEEERDLMAREGCVLPVPENPDEAVVLTDEQERVLKAIRRKMRNKESAKESRKRKADYIDTLEKRVKIETGQNTKLKSRVQELEQENEALSARLHYMQSFVQKLITGLKPSSSNPASNSQKSTCIFVMFFALCLVIAPRNGFLTPGHTGGDSLVTIDNNSVPQSSLEALIPNAENAVGMAPRLIPQSFIFTYESSLADRGGDL